MFPSWVEFGQNCGLYRRVGLASAGEVTQELLQQRLDRQELEGQELRDIVLLEEELSQCKRFLSIFPEGSDR